MGWETVAADLIDSARSASASVPSASCGEPSQASKPRGSHAFRKLLREARDEAAEAAAAELQLARQQDRGIAYARSFRKKPGEKQQLRCFAVECREIGSDMQRALAVAASKGIRVGQQHDATAARVLFEFRHVSSGSAEAQKDGTSPSTVASYVRRTS